MPLKGYTDVDRVAVYLGRELDPREAEFCASVVLPAVEDWIDRETGHAWLDGGTVSAERHLVYGPELTLAHVPVTAVSSVVDDAGAAVGFTVHSLALGLIALHWQPTRVWVTYTHTEGLPGSIRQAATELAAAWMPEASGTTLPAGVKSYSVGGELRVEFMDGAERKVPPSVRNLLRGYKALFV